MAVPPVAVAGALTVALYTFQGVLDFITSSTNATPGIFLKAVPPKVAIGCIAPNTNPS